MPKYEINIEGSNFAVQFHATHRRRKHGFVTKFFLEAQTSEAAAAATLDHVNTDEDILSVARNEPGDDATLKIGKVVGLARWPKATRPRIGLVWYPEDGQPQEGLKKQTHRRGHAAL